MWSAGINAFSVLRTRRKLSFWHYSDSYLDSKSKSDTGTHTMSMCAASVQQIVLIQELTTCVVSDREQQVQDHLMISCWFFTRTYSGKWFQCVSMSWTFSTGRGCAGMFSILEFETCGSARPEHAETKVLDIVWNMCLLVLCSTEAIGSIPHWWQNYFEHWIKTIGIGVHFISRLMQRLVSTGRWQKLSQWVIQWVWQFSQHFDSILIISPILSTSFYHPFLSMSIQRIQSPPWPPERLDGILVDRLVELKYTGNVRGSALHFDIRQRLRFNDWKRIIVWRIDILYHIISH
jgi:hypothetical protein